MSREELEEALSCAASRAVTVAYDRFWRGHRAGAGLAHGRSAQLDQALARRLIVAGIATRQELRFLFPVLN
jgi:hypothetical protein